MPGRVWRRVWLIEGQLQKFNPQFKANNDSSKTVAKNYRHRPFFTFIPHINKNHVQWEKFLNVTIQKTTIISFHILSLNYLIFLCTEYFPKRFLATDLISIQLVPCKKTRYHSQHMLSFFSSCQPYSGFFSDIVSMTIKKQIFHIIHLNKPNLFAFFACPCSEISKSLIIYNVV